jgi:hypothetical protein
MAPKYHPTLLSGGDRKALNKELGRSRAMANILTAQSAEIRAKAETMLQQADKLLCEGWNERMWADGGPIDPSPTIDQALNGGYAWIEIECSRCRTKRTSTWPRCAIHRPRSCTTWRAASAAASVLRPDAGRLPRCYSWPSGAGIRIRRPETLCMTKNVV